MQARDEEHSAAGHATMVPQPPAAVACSGSHRRRQRDIAARIRATDSASGVTEVSMTSSGATGGS